MLLLSKREWSGMEHVPLTGPAILVWNHYSDIDPLVVAHYVWNAGRHPRFLLKESILRIPVVGPVVGRTGQIPVKRGSADAADAVRVLADELRMGHVVIMSPEGTVTKEPNHWPMKGKTGVARLALETGAPVIPIVQWGALAIHDRGRSPKFKFGRKPVTVRALPAVDLDRWRTAPTEGSGAVPGAEVPRETLAAVTDRIMESLRDGLAEIRGETAPELFDPRRRRSEDRDREESEPTE
ncbi:1-acyl-sn-glycerol-3-phosphate acyltransferase [Glycomyces paridis]|uniref:1-acyl-sn-glycerol-3-phosphate acyltransferase n=2 Tax=Glycomyces paridis TaxID=2126555 RepID=A0A4S8PHG6_9ACTN|nr:1-acyl-sn-glycerol-3-phosphate acyltransferase [Glycomyces paridis]